MILGITDGVELTNLISNAPDAGQVLSDFFCAQIAAFGEHGCADHWHVVKTTGDGLIILADDEECVKSKKKSHRVRRLEDFLLAMRAATLACEEKKIALRSVVHYCLGEKLVFGSNAKPARAGSMVNFSSIESRGIHVNQQALQTDVFGLEIIRLARIVGIAKGPFHLLTIDFIKQLVDANDITEEEIIAERVVAYKEQNPDLLFDIDPNWVGLPYVKGFSARGKWFDVSFLKPYLVWEVSYGTGQASS